MEQYSQTLKVLFDIAARPKLAKWLFEGLERVDAAGALHSI